MHKLSVALLVLLSVTALNANVLSRPAIIEIAPSVEENTIALGTLPALPIETIPNFEEGEPAVEDILPSCADGQPIAATRPAEVPLPVETFPNLEDVPIAATRPAEVPIVIETLPNFEEAPIAATQLFHYRLKPSQIWKKKKRYQSLRPIETFPNLEEEEEVPIAATRPAEVPLPIETFPNLEEEVPLAATRPAEVPILIETIPIFDETPIAATRPAEVPLPMETFPNLEEEAPVSAPIAATRPAEVPLPMETFPNLEEEAPVSATRPAEVPLPIETFPNLEEEEEVPIAATRKRKKRYPAEVPLPIETFPNLGEEVHIAATRPAEVDDCEKYEEAAESSVQIQILPAFPNLAENLELETPVNTAPEVEVVVPETVPIVVEEDQGEAVFLPQIQILPIYDRLVRL
ncbi:hypothetical protein QE152_g6763 [Popillia japonica]|uniref:Uncharacterized protein n=1 Tax=Popillia japonica TaxID=7064 RepID=A0AAW1MI18_POPJA